MSTTSLIDSTATVNAKRKFNLLAEMFFWVVLLIIGVLAFLYLRQIDATAWLATRNDETHQQKRNTLPGMMNPQYSGIGQTSVISPWLAPAGIVSIPGDAEVIGIDVDGKKRAYVVRTLDNISRQVVNDLVDNLPISVTYCNLTDCVKVFTGKANGCPLDIRGAGRGSTGNLVLQIKENKYYQKTGRPLQDGDAPKFPYPEFPYERTTWRQWREAHSDTLVYDGYHVASPFFGSECDNRATRKYSSTTPAMPDGLSFPPRQFR